MRCWNATGRKAGVTLSRTPIVTLDHLNAHWSVTVDGRTVQSGVLALPLIGPGESAELDVQLHAKQPLVPFEHGAEGWLNIGFTLAADCIWGEQGHELAWAQFAMQAVWQDDTSDRETQETNATGSLPITRSLSCTEEGLQLVLANDMFRIAFDTLRPGIASLRINGKELVNTGPRLNFWRAPIENDMYVLAGWRKAHLDRLTERIDGFRWNRLDEGTIRLSWSSRIAPPVYDWGFRCETTYTVTGSGLVVIDLHGVPEGSPPSMLP
ncbi:hypothetical protein PAAL109150_04395 [Paenibacillus alkaliterrae]